MTLGETLGLVVGALREAGVPHMISGSIASTFHGEPRATQDIDMVIDPIAAAALDDFVSYLDRERFYVGDHVRAFRDRGMFNVIDKTNGWKVDLIVRHDREFSVAEFARRRPTTIEGVDVEIATPEDVVLAKLEWARQGESERQWRDVRAIVATNEAVLDRTYLELWAARLDLTDDLRIALDDH